MKKELSENTPSIKTVRIQSADELMALIEAPLECKFGYRGKVITLPVYPLSASTAEKVRELRRKALPPFRRERGPNGSYDDLDPAYLKARDENEKKARALVIYTHCPIVAEKKVGLIAVDDIYAHVQSIFTENILEVISLTIQEGGMDNTVEERVDFTSADGSES